MAARRPVPAATLCGRLLVLLGIGVLLAAVGVRADDHDLDCDADPLLCPYSPTFSTPAPPVYLVRVNTNNGYFVINVTRSWAPHGADRFYQLVTNGFYDGTRFFRVLPNFVAQFGIAADPQTAQTWESVTIPNDAQVLSNVRGTVTYAAEYVENTGDIPDCHAAYCAVNRTTQLFINYGDNARLDQNDFAPFGVVQEGMNVVDAFYAGYGECADACDPPNATRCPGPNQTDIYLYGEAYLRDHFPLLSSIVAAEVIYPAPAPYFDLVLTVCLIGGVLVVAVVFVVVFVVRRRLRELRDPTPLIDDEPEPSEQAQLRV